MLPEDNGNNRNAVAIALSNRVVLHNIFKFLTTTSLMSSCSLVNKLWNNETRIFIHDNRKCTLRATRTTENVCQFLPRLYELCRQIKTDGRVVPYNGWTLTLPITTFQGHECENRSRDGEMSIEHVTSHLKLTYLEINCRSKVFRQPLCKPLLEFLHAMSRQLKTLRVHGIGGLDGAFASWEPYFPQLEHVSFSCNPLPRRANQPEQVADRAFQKILDGSPNLKKISPLDLDALRTIPADKYGLLDGFELKRFSDPADLRILDKILEAKPTGLETLRVSSYLDRHNALVGPELKSKFDSTLLKVLETFHQTLKTIEMNASYRLLWQYAHRPLVSLSRLELNWDGKGRNTQEILSCLSSIDYARRMPRLKEVKLCLGSMDGWSPGNDPAGAERCSLSVHKITIHADFGPIDLSLFGRLFPNISSLVLHIFDRGQCPEQIENVLSFCQIWQLWPNLQELEVTGSFGQLRKSYDDEFCGIDPKEAELLAEENDDEELKALHVVPIGHGLLSMNNLRKLRMNLNFTQMGDHTSEPCPNFISKVTELVAFRKLPRADISISWSFRDDLWRTKKFSVAQNPQTLWTESIKGVLENQRVLHHIFSHFPTSFLLSSCSLVKKSWNKEARKFIVQNRKLTLAINDMNSTSTCALIQEWNQRCSQLVGQKRTIPWNSLKINLNPCTFATSHLAEDIDEKMMLGSQENLKYLDFEWKFPWLGADCAVHRPLEALLRQAATELQGFTIRHLPTNFGQLLADSASKFPKLEEITLRSLPGSDFGMKERSTIRQITEAAPGLRKILVKDPESLELVPEDNLRLLDTLKFHFRGLQDQGLYMKVAQCRPTLRKLGIFQRFQCQGQKENFQLAFNTALEQLLTACHQTLEIISIESVYPIAWLSCPPLQNLRKLKLKTTVGPLETFSDALLSIEYERSMPRLEEVVIKMADFVEMDSTSGYYITGNKAWPSIDGEMVKNERLGCSQSVRKLTLELHVKAINVSVLRALFPNISLLEITGKPSALLKRDSLPLVQIFEFWPGLQELKIAGANNFLRRSLDADICGIHEEEAELLRTMDTSFLNRVQIVPIKPCLLTMPNLRTLGIEFGTGDDSKTSPSECNQSVISSVGELVALQRMPDVEFSITGINSGSKERVLPTGGAPLPRQARTTSCARSYVITMRRN